VEEMAAHYVELMRARQPRGPYFLGGWCYGGIIALEMAQQLRAAGEETGKERMELRDSLLRDIDGDRLVLRGGFVWI